jgi:hypothetical protein
LARGNRLFAKEPEEESENHTDQNAGHEREVESEVPARVMNITRQPPEPVLPKPCPHDNANRSNEQPEQHEELAEIIHVKRSLCRGNGYFKQVSLDEPIH